MIQAQKGTKDILPQESPTWQMMEKNALEIFNNANFQEIRTPIFEATELFARGVGDSTDIVNKEMYTFEKADRSITLRPENTAGVVRAYIENGLHRNTPPVKLWYKGAMFRYERPQAGRQRQFHQLGVEMFGSIEAIADAECINTAVKYLKSLGLNDLEVEINSLGCPKCRETFRNALRELIKPNLEKYCDDCKVRYEKNPLRILDCKNPACNELLTDEKIQTLINSNFICDECSAHFEELKKYLDELNVKYNVNKQLVRGLDYYNRTVFEIKSNNLGSQNAVCGGGRYDGLVEMLGGPSTPAIGWAMGMERLFALIEKKSEQKLNAFVVSDNSLEALKLCEELRAQNISCDFDYSARKFKKQFEKASKVANFAVVLGEDELKNNTLTVKNLETSEQKVINRNEISKNLF